MFDLRIFSICESRHRIHNPLTESQLADFGSRLELDATTRILDLACGSGELLCTWSRDYGVSGTGVDLNLVFIDDANRRAQELSVTDSVTFVHADAAGYVAAEPVDVVGCVGATWIGGGVPGTLELLRQSVVPGGILLVGEPYWRTTPPNAGTLDGLGVASVEDYMSLPELLGSFGDQGYDVVDMICATEQSWDRYQAPQWLTMRRWADANPDHELNTKIREMLAVTPARYAEYTRTYFGWGVFALIAR